MDKMPSVKEAKDLHNELQDRSIDFGRPSFVTTNPRGEPRELLRQFHFNYPFFPVVPSPRLAVTVIPDDTIDVQIYLPDGTIWVSFSGDAYYYVSFDGTIGSIAGFAANAIMPGIINTPPPNIAYLVYPNKSLYVRSQGNPITIIPYISTEAAALRS